MPGLEGTEQREVWKGDLFRGRSGLLEGLRSHLCHQPSSGAPEISWGVSNKLPYQEEAKWGCCLLTMQAKGARASAHLQKFLLTQVAAHNNRFSQVPAGSGQERLGLHVWNMKTGSLSWHSWGLKMDGEYQYYLNFPFSMRRHQQTLLPRMVQGSLKGKCPW